MIDVGIGTRKVVVVGRDPGPVETEPWVDDAADRAVPLLLLTVGYPVSAEQAQLVASLIDEAFDRGVRFEAVMVSGRAGLAGHLLPDDDLVVAARGRERRQLEAVVKRPVAHRDGRLIPAWIGRSARLARDHVDVDLRCCPNQSVDEGPVDQLLPP